MARRMMETVHSRRTKSTLEGRRVSVIIATDLACVALVLLGICSGLLASCAMVEGDSNSFTVYRGGYASSPYTFSSTEPRLLTLTLTVNTYSRMTGDGYLDFFFVDSFNYHIYLHPELGQSLTSLVGKENAGYGVTMTLDSFSPVVGDTYHLVVDNTDTWGAHSVYDASGSYGLVGDLNPPHVMSGHVRNSESAMPISGATVSVPDGHSAITDDSGYYSIGGLEDGTYTVSVSAPGMKTLKKSVHFSGSDVTADFNLVPQGGGPAISNLGLMAIAAAAVVGLVIAFLVLHKKMARRQVPESVDSGASETNPPASSQSQRIVQNVSALPSQAVAFFSGFGKGGLQPETAPTGDQIPIESVGQGQLQQVPQGTMCKKCGMQNRSGSKFCGSCGIRLEPDKVWCTKCGAPIKDGAKFCPSCGRRIAFIEPEPLAVSVASHASEDGNQAERYLGGWSTVGLACAGLVSIDQLANVERKNVMRGYGLYATDLRLIGVKTKRTQAMLFLIICIPLLIFWAIALADMSATPSYAEDSDLMDITGSNIGDLGLATIIAWPAFVVILWNWLRDDVTPKTLAELEYTKDIEVKKDEIEEITVALEEGDAVKQMNMRKGAGSLRIRLSSGRFIFARIYNTETFQRTVNLMSAFCPGRLKVQVQSPPPIGGTR